MSKRDQGASLTSYMGEGFAPEAIVNYLCLLGWSPKDNREVVPVREVVQIFDLPQILRHNARFDLDKLHWLHGEYIRLMTDERFCELAIPALARAGFDTARYPSAYVKAALATCKGKKRLFSELADYGGFYFAEDVNYDAEAAAKDFTAENRERLKRLREVFAGLPSFTAAALENSLKETAKQLGVKAGGLVHPARLACTGKTAGPSLYHLLEVLGKERVLHRLDRAIAAIP
jgi:glutamyl/glutaminyl-tRNA synthetase